MEKPVAAVNIKKLPQAQPQPQPIPQTQVQTGLLSSYKFDQPGTTAFGPSPVQALNMTHKAADKPLESLSSLTKPATFVAERSQQPSPIPSATSKKSRMIDHRDTMSSRQSNARLSRMNSKMSLVSSRKKGPGAGLKLKIDELK